MRSFFLPWNKSGVQVSSRAGGISLARFPGSPGTPEPTQVPISQGLSAQTTLQLVMAKGMLVVLRRREFLSFIHCFGICGNVQATEDRISANGLHESRPYRAPFLFR